MSHSFYISLDWKNENEFSYEKYNRAHSLSFNGGQTLLNSAAPEYLGDPKMSNPEELLAGALMSCHMMSFLALAAKTGYSIESYQDRAEAVLDKNEEGRMAIVEINLRPEIVFTAAKIPNSEELAKMHDKAHKICFIANSIKTKVNIL